MGNSVLVKRTHSHSALAESEQRMRMVEIRNRIHEARILDLAIAMAATGRDLYINQETMELEGEDLLDQKVRQSYICACRVGGGLPSSRTRFVFSVFRLVSRRCHAISSILGCPARPSQNRACAIHAHGSSHRHSRAIITGRPVPAAWVPQTGSRGCVAAAMGIACPSGRISPRSCLSFDFGG